MYEAMYKKAKKENSDYVECQYHYLQIDAKGQEKEIPQYGHVQVQAAYSHLSRSKPSKSRV